MAVEIEDTYAYPAFGTIPSQGRRIQRTYDTGEDNAPLVVTTAVGLMRRIERIIVAYDATVTKSALVAIKSGAGEIFNFLIETLAITAATKGMFLPERDIYLHADDQIEVTAPAGGSGVHASILIETLIGGV